MLAAACSHGVSAGREPLARRAEALARQIGELHQAGRYPEAIPLAEVLVANHLQLFGPDDERTARSLNDLGLTLRLSGRPQEAIPQHERALAILTRRLGPRDPEIARTRDLLGSARLVAGDLAGAEPDLVAALEIARAGSGPGSLATAHSLNSVGYLRGLQGSLAEARQLFEQSLAIRETLPALRNLAGLAADEGDLRAARKGFEAALAFSLRAQGSKHPETARVQGELAAVLLKLEDFSGAQEAYRQALATADEVFGSRHPDRARYLGGLGAVAKARGDYPRAREHFAAALALYEEVHTAGHPDIATAASNLGTVLDLLGRGEEAVACYERALAIDRKVYGVRGLQTATTLENLAVARTRLGELTAARRLQEEALAIRREKLDPRDPAIARSLVNLGAIRHALGDLVAAQGLYEEALAIRLEKLGPDHSRTAAVWHDLAALCRERGDLSCARDLYERALAIREAVLGGDHPSTALTLNNLGMVMVGLGDSQRALELLTRARAIWERVYGADHPAVATVLENLGSLFQFTDPESERLFLEKALAIRVRTLDAKHPDVARSHHNLGVLLRTLGHTAESRHHLEQTVALRGEMLGSDHPDTAASLEELSATELVAGNVDRALDLAERAAAAGESWVRTVLKLGSDAEKRLFLRTVAGSADWAVTVHLRDNPTSARTARLALTAVLRTKGRALDATVAGRRQLRRRQGPEERAFLAQLAELRQEQAALLLRPPAGTAPVQTRNRLGTLAEEIRRIEAELARRSVALGEEAQAIDLGSVQEQLPAGAALIELVVYQPWDAAARGNPWGRPRYGAYVLRSIGPPAGVDLGDVAVLDQAVEAFRRALSEPGSDARVPGRALDHLTLARVRPLLGDARTLLIAPDGNLNLVPFAALADERDRYLLENYRISYLASGRELLADGEKSCDLQEPPLVVGGPDFGGTAPMDEAPTSQEPAGDSFPATVSPLPGAAAEAAAIGALLDLAPARILTGGLAREAAVKAVRGPRLLHLATHGFFLPDLTRKEAPAAGDDRLPERARETQVEVFVRSGLAFAGYNHRQQAPGANDGVLTALEAMDLDLCGTEIATLSACETGVGEARSGQGVFGLRRAIALAGASSQLLTLWKVPDQATRDFMVSFYGQLRKGVSLAEALRQTQLATLRRMPLPGEEAPLARGAQGLERPYRVSTARDHPYYWAAFILSGQAERAVDLSAASHRRR